jgi:hypothetical protein
MIPDEPQSNIAASPLQESDGILLDLGVAGRVLDRQLLRMAPLLVQPSPSSAPHAVRPCSTSDPSMRWF